MVGIRREYLELRGIGDDIQIAVLRACRRERNLLGEAMLACNVLIRINLCANEARSI